MFGLEKSKVTTCFIEKKQKRKKKRNQELLIEEKKFLTFEEGSVFHHSLTPKRCAASLNDYATL